MLISGEEPMLITWWGHLERKTSADYLVGTVGKEPLLVLSQAVQVRGQQDEKG
jgi:hypothetical protein